MSVNPFEPPRSDEGAPTSALASDVLSEDAWRELVKSAPWARWTARLGLASGTLSVVQSVLALRRATKPGELVATLVILALAIPWLVIWVVLARRYADHAERLQNREPRALAGVISAQRAVFRMQVVVAAVVFGGTILLTIIMAGAGMIAR